MVMKNKSLIVFALIVGALVFDGVAHFHKKASDAASSQTQVSQNQPEQNEAVAPGTADPANTQTQDQAANAGDPNMQNDASADPNAANNNDAGGQNAGQNNDKGDDATANAEAGNDANIDANTAQSAPAPIIVPAGTMLTVRLAEDLGSSISSANQRFAATLDRDVVVHGQTVISAGSTVHGRVVLAKPAGQLAGEAKLALRLTSVSLNNGTVTILTSTHTYGPTIKGKNKVGKFMKGLVKRAAGQEREVLLAEQSPCSFTLQQRLAIQ
jgi:hypothetical protein